MKIAVAQARPVKGDIQANISNHLKLIEQASLEGADAVFFPELSLTGYEPTLAKELAGNQDDHEPPTTDPGLEHVLHPANLMEARRGHRQSRFWRTRAPELFSEFHHDSSSRSARKPKASSVWSFQ